MQDISPPEVTPEAGGGGLGHLRVRGARRTREIRPSGIAGGPMETWVRGVGLRPRGKLREPPPNPNTVARHSSIPTQIHFSRGVHGLMANRSRPQKMNF